ncbi:MAG: redox-sensing transcriptional repressor Rex [Planctomycetes bacterium]|nr:redox-sensing transcriptional repressor Rex [Planctomycetota bacterium]
MTSSRSKIPRATVKRLSLYLRELESRHNQNQKTINSKQLGDVLSLTDAQVRKDLAYFGQFGYPGVGYRILELIENLRRILGTDRKWNAVVIGAGNIGRAIMAYQRFRQKGFEVVAVLDNDRSVVGQVISGHHVRPMSDLNDLVQQRDVKIGILAVPAPVAQEVADQLIEAGVQGILNFAPVRLDVHDAVGITSVDFSVALEQLAFQISLGVTGSLEEENDQ